MGEFDQVNRELAKLAAAAKHEGLKYLRDRAGAGSEFDPDSPRVVSYRCSESTWSAILVNFDGTQPMSRNWSRSPPNGTNYTAFLPRLKSLLHSV